MGRLDRGGVVWVYGLNRTQTFYLSEVSPHLFFLGHDPLPERPHCGYDYREKEGFRWDVFVYLLAILGFVSFLLGASNDRAWIAGSLRSSVSPQDTMREQSEKLPGSGSPHAPFESPYQETGR